MACFTDLQLRHNLASVVFNSYSYATHSDISQKGPSIKYVTLFWTNFDSPPSVTLCHTSRDLLKYVTHLGPPQFVVVHAYIHVFTEGLCYFAGGFVRGLVWGFFVWKVSSRVVFVRPPSVRIHQLQKKTKHHFQF